MPSKKDLFFGLKKKNIYPKNKDYSDHVKNWLGSNDHKICTKSEECKKVLPIKTSWLEKFSYDFKVEIRHKWKERAGNLKYGDSKAMDAYFDKLIEIQYDDCSCNDNEVGPMDTSQSQCSYR